MKTLAIVDLETSSVDVATTNIVEIAVCLFSLEHGIATSSYATTVHAPENAAAAINGLPVEALVDATPLDRALKSVSVLVAKADVFLAHNGDSFDRPILERVGCAWAAPQRWVDTLDFAWPRSTGSRKLVDLALAHGLGVGSAHRALDDVLLLARLLTRAAELGMNIEEQVQLGLRPRSLFAVAATGFDEVRNALAKDAGFRWDAARKLWTRKMAVDDTAALPFAVRELAA